MELQQIAENKVLHGEKVQRNTHGIRLSIADVYNAWELKDKRIRASNGVGLLVADIAPERLKKMVRYW